MCCCHFSPMLKRDVQREGKLIRYGSRRTNKRALLSAGPSLGLCLTLFHIHPSFLQCPPRARWCVRHWSSRRERDAALGLGKPGGGDRDSHTNRRLTKVPSLVQLWKHKAAVTLAASRKEIRPTLQGGGKKMSLSGSD